MTPRTLSLVFKGTHRIDRKENALAGAQAAVCLGVGGEQGFAALHDLFNHAAREAKIGRIDGGLVNSALSIEELLA